MTTGAICRLCLCSLERSEPRTPAPARLTNRILSLGIEVHKSCYLTELGVATEDRTVHPRLIPTEPKAAGVE